ncbi:MAG: ATP-binding protein [Rhodocyclaceae bacterium]|nr:ATP-binding protein [Rhodocyclaceae bacterium]
MSPLLARDFPANTSALVDVRAAVHDAAVAAGCNEEITSGWVLAVNEACMNVIQHAYGFADGESLRIELWRDGDELVTLICDDGRASRIEDLQPRPLDEIRPGGLGVHFIRELTDTMAYLPPSPQWRNRLRLARRLTGSPMERHA